MEVITIKIQGRYSKTMYCTTDLGLALISDIKLRFGDNAYFIEDKDARTEDVIKGQVGHINSKGKRTLSNNAIFIDFKIN